MTDHDRLGELAGPYALGALREDDRWAFEAHLAACVACRLEVRGAALVAEGLGRAVDQQEPPAGLRDRVLKAAVASTKADTRLDGPASGSLRGPWLLLAASLAAVALGLYAWTLQTRLRETDAALESARAELAALQTQVVELRRGIMDDAWRTAEVLGAPDVVRVELAGQPAAPQATGRAFYSPSRGLVFTAANLPSLPAGRVYQLWVVTGTVKVSVGVMSPDSAGRLRDVSHITAGRPDAIALTIEREGGVPQPTGEVYLLGSL